MTQSILRWSLVAVFAAAALICQGVAHAQFRGRESPPPDADRVPEELEKLVNEIDEETLAKPPERDFKVEKGAAEQVKLFRADPKLLENKFRARMVLSVGAIERMQSAFGKNSSEAFPTLSGYFKFLSELCPKDQLPSQVAMDFLTSIECDRDVQWSYDAALQDEGRRERYLSVYATTEELAEQRARAIVQLFDGFCRALQRDSLTKAKKSLEAARKGYEEVARQTESIKAKEKLLDKPSEITTEILTQLRAQKVMIGVELAGLEARIKACNRMLLPTNVDLKSEKARESVSDMKVRAEVELVGTKEKLDRINALIAEGKSRTDLREEIDRLKAARQELQRDIVDRHQRGAEAYVGAVSLYYAPLEIKDNKITISPIEWTN
ncbi:MAG TPA: hypothetical protein VMP01_26900 [Pirellulaceae bacterium]|nr:hypothetical protein [Pirellulaceae bacterium]